MPNHYFVGYPQSPVLGPILLQASPLWVIVWRYNRGFHFMRGDSHLYMSFDSQSDEAKAAAVAQIQACASEERQLYWVNKLRLNSDKP